MQINVSTRHGQLGADAQEKIEAKLGKLKRFHDRITSADVIVDLESQDEPKLEVRLSIERAKDILAQNKGSNLLGALDGAVRKLEEQLRRRKEKLVGHRSTGRRTEVPPNEMSEEVDAVD